MTDTVFQDLSFPRTASTGVVVAPTYWGYVIRGTQRELARARLVEYAAFALAFGAVVIVLALWMYPGADHSVDLVPFKIVPTLTLSAFAVWAVGFGHRGRAAEFQVDTAAREVRSVLRNRAGQSVIIEKLAFSEVGSVFMLRSKVPGAKARLCVRSVTRRAAVEVARAHESALDPVWTMLCRDLRPAAAPQRKMNGYRPISRRNALV